MQRQRHDPQLASTRRHERKYDSPWHQGNASAGQGTCHSVNPPNKQLITVQPRHVKYWLRCLKTLLPSMYTSNDSNRMYLAYFILSACDILDVLTSSTSPAERKDWIDWIYHCQHPDGGFRMWPGTDFGERATIENARWDPANINATYFALASLLILGDDLKLVNRKETLRWVCKMQRDDGSFGETLVDGKQEGGRDPRLGYCATGVRHILRGASPPGPVTLQGETIGDINFDKYIECLRRAEVRSALSRHARVEVHTNTI